MAKQVIDIGIEGNDGTGDAIREAFNKVNENFDELYAAFGVEGQLTFSSLADTPDNLENQENKIPAVNADATKILFRELVSNGAESGNAFDDTVRFDFTSIPGKIVVKTRNSQVSEDLSPTLAGAT